MSDLPQENTDSDFSPVDLLIALGQERWTLFIFTLIGALTGLVVSLTTPATYLSRASIIPLQQTGGGGLAALAGMSGMAGLAGLTSIASSIKSTDEMFIALMRSYAVQLSLIEQFKLKDRYGTQSVEQARQVLTSSVTFVSEKKSGMLLIEALDKDPEFAAQLANAHVNELNQILSRLAVTQAQQRRAYFEQQIIRTQTKIPELEFEFKEAQKNSGLEVASLLSEASTLPGQIAAKELQLQVLSRFAASQNPELKRLSVEISALRAQMARYELGSSGKSNEGAKTSFIQKAIQAYNTLKIQETLLESYVRQLELAKVDESKEGPTVQVVDEARAPEMRAKPQRKKIVLAYTVTGLCVAFILAAIRAFIRYILSTPDGLQRWIQLKRAWGIA